VLPLSQGSDALEARRTYRLYGVVTVVPDDLVLRANEVDAEPELTVDVVYEAPLAPWEMAEELYATMPRVGVGVSDFVFSRLPDRDVITIAGTGQVHLLDERMIFYLQEPDHVFLVEIVLLGLAMAFWLERRGSSTLHGSAVSLGGKGVAFVATGGTGKSSLAAYLAANGDPLITEDLLALSWQDGTSFAEPAVAQFRLWPEVAAQYSENWEALPQPHPRFSKRKLLVGEDGVGSLAPKPVPLRRIYVLQRTERPDYEPTVIPLSGGDGLAELLTHSYLPEIAEKFGWQARRLGQLAQLLGVAPVQLLRYRSGTDQLHAVRAAIVEDLNR
jgi:hypothetical protein